MKRKKIAVLGANLPLLPFYKQTRNLGYEIHGFSYEVNAACKDYADFYYPVSFADTEIVLRECKRIGIHGITSFSLESALPSVNFIASEMGLEGNPPECVEYTANKFAMMERLRQCNIKVPEYICVSSEDDLLNHDFNFPQIVKPVDNSGSRGVTKVNERQGMIKAFHRALTFSKSKKVLISKFIEGREFSVEHISCHGQHYFLSITDKVTTNEPYFVELEHHQPADFSQDEKNRIKEVTQKVLTALAIHSCATFTEIRMDENGELYVLEIGARAPGDMLASHLVRLSTGYDFVKGILEVATGDFNIPVFGEPGYAGVYYLTKETIKIHHFILNSECFPQIMEKEISRNEIISVKESGDRSGYFIYHDKEKFDIKKYFK